MSVLTSNVMNIPVAAVRAVLAALMILTVCGASSARAQQPASTQPPGGTPSETRIEELERRVRELESRLLELEGARSNRPTTVATEPVSPEQPTPTAAASTPSADQSSVSQTGPISGYMDFH